MSCTVQNNHVVEYLIYRERVLRHMALCLLTDDTWLAGLASCIFKKRIRTKINQHQQNLKKLKKKLCWLTS